jgi:hypothetical protein
VDTPANAEHVFGEGVEAGDVLHEQLRSQQSWQLHNPLAVFVPNKLAENKSSLTASQVALLGYSEAFPPRLWMDLPLW